MTSERVLAHLAQRFAISAENVATEALTWILRRSPAAARSISVLVRTCGAEVPDNLTFVGQVGVAETGRPDIVGTDPENAERVLIEAKFAAALTPQQPAGYLERLPAGKPACVLVVAPAIRVATLWVELLRALPAIETEVPAPSFQAKTPLSRAVGADRVLALVSWRELVELVVDTLRSSGEHDLTRDAEQLLALTEAMDAAAFDPAVPGDFGPRVARQIQQLHVLIDQTYGEAVARKQFAKYSNSASHGRIFYGWYLEAPRSGKQVWFGYLPRAWSIYGISPLWAHIRVSPTWSRQRLAAALSSFGHAGGSGLFDDPTDGGFLIPLAIPYLVGQSDVVKSLADQLALIGTRLDAEAQPGEHVKDEPLPEDALSTGHGTEPIDG